MDHSTEVFVGIDVAKARNAVAIADGERGGEVRYLGEVDASEESMRRLVKRIVAKHRRAHFCYVSASAAPPLPARTEADRRLRRPLPIAGHRDASRTIAAATARDAGRSPTPPCPRSASPRRCGLCSSTDQRRRPPIPFTSPPRLTGREGSKKGQIQTQADPDPSRGSSKWHLHAQSERWGRDSAHCTARMPPTPRTPSSPRSPPCRQPRCRPSPAIMAPVRPPSAVKDAIGLRAFFCHPHSPGSGAE